MTQFKKTIRNAGAKKLAETLSNKEFVDTLVSKVGTSHIVNINLKGPNLGLPPDYSDPGRDPPRKAGDQILVSNLRPPDSLALVDQIVTREEGVQDMGFELEVEPMFEDQEPKVLEHELPEGFNENLGDSPLH